MKTPVLLIIPALAGCLMASAQKKNNGTIYIEHPALGVVNAFGKAFVSGDSAKMASVLTDDFKAINGTTSNLTNYSIDKKAYVNNLLIYSKRLDYFTTEPIPGSYPDALEFTKDNKDNETIVQDYILIKGVDKQTGVKIDAAAHNIYSVTKDGKIKRIITYSNGKVLDEIVASFVDRTNGKIYNHHENINTVRKAMYAWEKGDMDKYFNFFTDNARFYDINNDSWETYHSKAEEKASIENFRKAFEIKSLDMFGYPDYLEYEMGNGRSVLSWWKLNLVRKKDKKEITLFMHLNQDFDDKGKMTNEVVYYNGALLQK